MPVVLVLIHADVVPVAELCQAVIDAPGFQVGPVRRRGRALVEFGETPIFRA